MDDLETENYVKYCHNRLQRSLIAQFRSGTLQLNIEIGRFRNIQLESRLCEFCNLDVEESEFHFLCECPAYESECQYMYDNIIDRNNSFQTLPDNEKFWYI